MTEPKCDKKIVLLKGAINWELLGLSKPEMNYILKNLQGHLERLWEVINR